MHVKKCMFFCWRVAPSIGAFGLQNLILLSWTEKSLFFWRDSPTAGVFWSWWTALDMSRQLWECPNSDFSSNFARSGSRNHCRCNFHMILHSFASRNPKTCFVHQKRSFMFHKRAWIQKHQTIHKNSYLLLLTPLWGWPFRLAWTPMEPYGNLLALSFGTKPHGHRSQQARVSQAVWWWEWQHPLHYPGKLKPQRGAPKGRLPGPGPIEDSQPAINQLMN